MTQTNAAVRYALWRTSLGDLFAAVTDRGLCALRLCEKREMSGILDELRRQHPHAELAEDADKLRDWQARVEDVLNGQAPADALPLDLVGTTFQKHVWQTLVKVPWGKTLSYTDLARKAGKPRAIRAVASACARNPIAFVIPCHRILSKNGGLGGYYWGLQMKRDLLEREQR